MDVHKILSVKQLQNYIKFQNKPIIININSESDKNSLFFAIQKSDTKNAIQKYTDSDTNNKIIEVDNKEELENSLKSLFE